LGLPQLGLSCGDLLQGPEEQIIAMATAGLIDAHPDAVAYVKDLGAKVVQLEDMGGALELSAAMTEDTTTPVV
jgi:hypothetical protein